MSKQTPTLLVTGFGPFPGAPQNPTQILINAIEKRAPNANPTKAKLVTAVLPTHWQKLPPALAALFVTHNPDSCLHLGYSAASPGFCLESTAYNQTCAQLDVDGQIGSCDPVIGDEPLQLKSNVPLKQLEQQLTDAGFNTTRSSDPGRYLCNMSYYLSLARSRLSLFVHIPAIKTDAGLFPKDHQGDHHLPLLEACEGVELVLKFLTKP